MKDGSLVVITSGKFEGCEAKVLSVSQHKAVCEIYPGDGQTFTLELPKAALKVKR